MKKIFLYILSTLSLFIFESNSYPKNGRVVQIDLTEILNARSVTTLSDGKLITWTKGIDGNGSADGYLTMTASLFNGDINPKALPDNPVFPANARHPEMLLHYKNNEKDSNQTVAVSGDGSFAFKVPAGNYSDLFLAFTSSEGASQIKVILEYTDGNISKSFNIPDYYQDIPENDPDFCYLVSDLAKWGKTNNMTENNHHNIDLLNIKPDSNRKLTSILIEKSEPGYLVFWAATGVIKQ